MGWWAFFAGFAFGQLTALGGVLMSLWWKKKHGLWPWEDENF